MATCDHSPVIIHVRQRRRRRPLNAGQTRQQVSSIKFPLALLTPLPAPTERIHSWSSPYSRQPIKLNMISSLQITPRPVQQSAVHSILLSGQTLSSKNNYEILIRRQVTLWRAFISSNGPSSRPDQSDTIRVINGGARGSVVKLKRQKRSISSHKHGSSSSTSLSDDMVVGSLVSRNRLVANKINNLHAKMFNPPRLMKMQTPDCNS